MSILGIDVSVWQDNNSTAQMVDFHKAKSSGAVFAFIKASQANWTDPDFILNWQNAKQAGLYRGSYHFLTWDINPLIQAEHYYNLIRYDMPDMPPVVDFEWWNTTPSNAADILLAMLNRLEALTGRIPMIYTAAGFWQSAWNLKTNWTRYPLWVAHYTTAAAPLLPAPWKTWAFWQFSSKGNGPLYGTESLNVDLNRFNGDEAALRVFCKLPPITPPAEPLTLEQRVTALEQRVSALEARP